MRIRAILLFVLALCASPLPAGAETFIANVAYDALDADPNDGICDVDLATPNSDPDPNDPDNELVGQCSLRAAIVLANQTAEPDGILLDPNPNVAGPGITYVLSLSGPGEDAGLTGDLDIATQMTISSDGTSRAFEITFIDAKRLKDRIFDVHPGVTFAISQVTLLNGRAPKDESGGCVRSAGSSTVNGSYFYRCSSSVDGGGVSVSGGTWSSTNVNFGSCKAKNEGGAFHLAAGTATMLRNTFARNRAATGGAIATRSDFSLRNGTIDGNRAKLGGGVALLGAGATSITHATISENAKVNLDASQNTGALVVGGSIVWGAATDCVGNVPSSGGNLEGGTSCGFTGVNDQQGQDPLLAPLNLYGGLVPTRTLATTSPAIDHGLDDTGACDLDARLKYRARRDPGGVTLADAGATDFAVPDSGPVDITSSAVTTATVGVPYSYDVEAENPLRESCITFALVPASETDPLPAGISIDAVTGLVSWTPAPGQEGAHPIRVEASSQGASLDGQSFTITVAPAP